ncbi:type I restriction endonuclease subunit R [Vampirovibrio sp.]|uniref:type I restriction endonuclease subunit R n=1 Tax=Vampirovibrio sp. TaxID=2717857 RepID=UPI00359323D4
MNFTESVVEDASLAWLEELGYEVVFGPNIAPSEMWAERDDYKQTFLHNRLKRSLEKINPSIPPALIEEAIRHLHRLELPSLIETNRAFHQLLAQGIPVEIRREDGSSGFVPVNLIDFETPDNNDWLAVNQFTVEHGSKNRRPDVVVFLNGLPLAVLELKNPADEKATIHKAYTQLQNYKNDISPLFNTNGILVISDGPEARIGTLSADFERFMPWRTVDGQTVASKGISELETLIKGVFNQRVFLDLLRYFSVFEDDGKKIIKKIAGYHQYHAVNKAIERTIEATQGQHRAGVVWHTQGSGKSLTMVFYSGKVIQHPAMKNPTLVILTDRNDLDDQLFGTFGNCHELLRQKPIQADDRDDIRALLKTGSGGVIFTTIQKFSLAEGEETFPELSDRSNIVVIADEAHRSQYGFKTKIDAKTGEKSVGFAAMIRQALPNASFIGFTGTPVAATDKNTQAVFGDYIDIYDIQRAVEDGATVRIYYESRLAKIELDESEKPKLDEGFEEVTEGEEEGRKEKEKSKWSRMEALVGAEKRVNLIAQDIVTHFENRTAAMAGKGLIVGMSRRICVALYDALIAIRPEWHSDDDNQGAIKVIMTGSSSDPENWQRHVRSKDKRDALAKRLKDPKDPLKLVIVRDMWLTGFDAPCLHTMYVDKPMKGHNLMQAIARVNRVFKDKQGGLVVDYIGIADLLKKALMEYTEGDRKEAGIPIEEAIAIMLEKLALANDLLHGYDYSKGINGTPSERLTTIAEIMEHILGLDKGKERFMQMVLELSHAFALASTTNEAIEVRDEVGFLQTIRAAFAKSSAGSGKTVDQLDTALQQIVSKAVSSTEIVDIFSAAGLKVPDISILSDEFLAEVQGMEKKNLALELLRKLLTDAIKTRSKKNVVQARKFSEMLENAIKRYYAKQVETAQIINELVEMAKDFQEAGRRGEELGLQEDEAAFYEALEVNDSAVFELGDDVLKTIAKELVATVKKNTSIDWTKKESVRAKLRVMVRRILRKYQYPPDKQESAIKTVMEQAEALTEQELAA